MTLIFPARANPVGKDHLSTGGVDQAQQTVRSSLRALLAKKRACSSDRSSVWKA
jgi:hypothetical protein